MATVEVGQIYVHEKGDRCTVQRVDLDYIFLQTECGNDRRTTRAILAKYYKLAP